MRGPILFILSATNYRLLQLKEYVRPICTFAQATTECMDFVVHKCRCHFKTDAYCNAIMTRWGCMHAETLWCNLLPTFVSSVNSWFFFQLESMGCTSVCNLLFKGIIADADACLSNSVRLALLRTINFPQHSEFGTDFRGHVAR